MKPFLLALVLSAFSNIVFAQSQKTPVAVFPFIAALSENRGRASQIQQIVVEILRAKSDIEIIDRSNDSMLVKELNYQIREVSMAANNLVQQGKLLGAKQMIVGTISNVACELQRTTGPGIFSKTVTTTSTYHANISFALQLSDVETGKVINQKAFNTGDPSGRLLGGLFSGSIAEGLAPSKEEAILNAIKATKPAILAWINESYPPEIKIFSIEDRDKKGFPQTVLVTGIDGTLEKGARVNINEVQMLDAGGGKSYKRTKKIGELKIKEKQGEITICTVTDGEKDLEEKIKTGAKMEMQIK